jgi:ABC-type glycerol-3-phosphate transport system substrate-binding protein
MSRRFTRRAALGALAASGAGYALLGPRGRPRRAGGRLVIEYWEKWTGWEAEALLRVVEAFNRSQDRVEVRCLTMSTIAQKALVAIAGGDPPDVLGLWGHSLPAYAESGALRELDELTGTLGFGPEHYADAVWPLQLHEGRRYAAINTCGTVALYCDRAAFRDAGLDPDRPPRTVSELDECAARLNLDDGRGGLRRAGFLHTEPGWWSWAWGFAFGGALYDPLTRRATAASAPNRRAYAWVQSHPRRYGTQRLERLRSSFGNYASPQQGFLARRVAMVVQGPWLANVIAAFAPELDYGATPVPVEDGLEDPEAPIGALEVDLLVVPRGARHPREALEFIAFMQRQENVELLSRLHAKCSPLRRVSEDFRRDHPNRALAVHERLLKSPRTFTAPAIRTWPHYRDEFVAGMDRIWSLSEPAESVLQSIEAAAQAKIDLAWERRLQRTRAHARPD